VGVDAKSVRLRMNSAREVLSIERLIFSLRHFPTPVGEIIRGLAGVEREVLDRCSVVVGRKFVSGPHYGLFPDAVEFTRANCYARPDVVFQRSSLSYGYTGFHALSTCVSKN